MTTVSKPLGESLAVLPSGREDGSRAGPAFGVTRHVTLPANALIALTVAAERARELARELAGIAAAFSRDADLPSQFGVVAANLQRIASSLSRRDATNWRQG